MNLKKCVIVNFRVEGTHAWPDCHLSEVNFLKHQHRHVFHIRIEKEVARNDREIEIVLFKRMLEEFMEKKYHGKFGNSSCEDIAQRLVERFNLLSCEVLEDGENGAKVFV